MTRALAIVGALVLAAVAAVPAEAGWSRARLMTSAGAEQALDVFQGQGLGTLVGPPDLSADGRFVAFDSRAANLLVQAGPAVQADAEGGVFRRDVDSGLLEIVAIAAKPAANPRTVGPVAVSADGRFVAFATARALLPADTNGVSDVYVRDMAAANAYTLVSSGTDAAPTTLPSTRSLSADGSRVLIRQGTTLRVRDLAAGGVTQITASADTENDPVGARAALSADGSAVAWVDADPRARVDPGQFLSGELPLGRDSASTTAANDPWANTTDILWQRVDGTAARRVATAGDSEDPACPAGSVLTQNAGLAPEGIRTPCDGVFRFTQNGAEPGDVSAVDLSADGGRIVFSFSNERRTGGTGLDLFLRDMTAPGGRKATTRELTSLSGGDVRSATVSADGRVVAFTATTDVSLLPAPTFVGTTLGTGVANAYAMDLVTQTVERVTRAYTGDPADGATDAVAASGDGRRISVRSDAANLLYGDANQRADVFVADRFDDTQPPLPVSGVGASAADAATEVRAVWRLSATVSRGGRVLYVDVRVPAAGRVTATASRRRSGAGAGAIVTRARVTTPRAGSTRLRLRLPQRYRRTARRTAGLPVKVAVEFRPAGRGATLARSLQSRFTVRSTPRGTGR